MAYGLKYYRTFGDTLGAEYKIEIYKEGHVGSTTEIDVVNVNLSRTGEMFDVVRGSELSVDVKNIINFGFESEFATAAYGIFYAKLIKDPSGTADTIWQGYSIPNTYTEPYEALPYFSSLKFNCGLGHLKYEKFYNSGTLYTGRKTILEVIRLCLNKLTNASTVGQTLREALNIYEDSLYGGSPTAAQSMINSIYVDVGIYKDVKEVGTNTEEEAWDCHKVLTKLLETFNVQLYSYGGYWYLEQIREKKTSPMTYRDFLPRVGSESTLTVDGNGTYTNTQSVNRSDLYPTNSGEISILPSLDRIRYKYKTQNIDFKGNNLIKNPCFNSIVGTRSGTTNGYPLDWQFNGVNETTYNAITNNLGGGVFTFNPHKWFRFKPSVQTAQSTLDSNVYIYQQKTAVPTSTSDKLRFQFMMKPVVSYTTGNSTQNNTLESWLFNSASITMTFMLKFGTYYLSGSDGSYSWTTTVSNFTYTLKRYGLGVPSFTSGVKIFGNNFTVDTPTLPQTGAYDMDFRVYLPFHNFYTYNQADPDNTITIDNIWISCVNLFYLPSASEPESEVILEHDIDEEEELIEIEVVHGDGPNTISQGSFRLSTDVVTDAWYRRGISESKGIHEIWIEDVSELRSDYIRRLNWNNLGFVDLYKNIRHTVGAQTTTYLINNFSWELTTGTYDFELIELASFSRLTYTTVQNATADGVDLSLGVQDPLNFGNGSFDASNAVNKTSYSKPSTVSTVNQSNANSFI